MSNIIMLVAMFAIIYFFMIRPQMTRQKKEKKFQEELKKGMKVVTTSGIHGKVVDISTTDTTVMIETNAGKIRFERSAISMEMTNKYQK
ncbi:MAG: preprotein translocase subunit YajC [Flavobacteriaceae bacterium]|nr:preprotein translocase subunit YajC [Flavobacteriaceae bacterium]